MGDATTLQIANCNVQMYRRLDRRWARSEWFGGSARGIAKCKLQIANCKLISSINLQSAICNQQLLQSAASPSLARFGRIRAVGRRAGARRPEEQLLAVRIGHIAAVGAQQRMVPRLVAVDDELRAGLQRVARDAAAQKRVRRAAFDHPFIAFLVGRELAWLRA